MRHLAAFFAAALVTVVSAGSTDDRSPMIIWTVTIGDVENRAYYSVTERRYRFVAPFDAGVTAQERMATLEAVQP